MSPNLSPVSTSRDDPYKDLKCGSGADLYQKEAGKIRTQGKSYGHATTVDMLSDDILLEIFGVILRLSDFHYCGSKYPLWRWHRLVHVCRRWRQTIFTSPLRLDLQLVCTFGTPVRKRLGCWPAFPLVIDYSFFRNKNLNKDITPEDEVNIFAALEQRDRVRHIDLSVSSLLMENLFAVMEEPFPALTHLLLSCSDEDEVEDEDEDEVGPVIPSKFLGGYAPRLHEVSFLNIPFPTIPAILSSASDLVKLQLEDVPRTPFPSPEAMVACLAAFTRLEDIFIGFRSGFQPDLPTTGPNQIHLPPETWVVLPAVASISYEGDIAYLEDFVARVNTPLLKSIDIKYSDEDFDLRVPELIKLIERSNLQPSRFGFAKIFFELRKTTFSLHSQNNPNECAIAIRIASWGAVGAQVVDMTRMLSQFSAMISDVVRLDVESESPFEYDEDYMDHDIMDDAPVRWVELFHPFIAVEDLRISYRFAEGVARAFEELTVETITQVLPALKSLDLGGDPRKIAEGLYNTFRAAGRLSVLRGSEEV